MKQAKDDQEEITTSTKIAFKLLPWVFVGAMVVLIYALVLNVVNVQLEKMLEFDGVKQVTAEHYVTANLISYARLSFAFAVSLGLGFLFRIFPYQRFRDQQNEEKRADNWIRALRIWCANTEKLSKLDPVLIEKFVNEGLRPYDEEHKKEVLGMLLDIKESIETPKQPKKVCLTYEGDLKAISNKENPRYRAELQAAVDLWLSFEVNPVPAGCSPKSEITARLVDWQDESHETFLDAQKDRITKMVNWDKDGNKQKPKQ